MVLIMIVGQKSVVVAGTISFITIALIAAQAGVKGIQAMQTNYTILKLDTYGTDVDRDGIADIYDDSDGDTIPDLYDATPYKALDTIVDFALQ